MKALRSLALAAAVFSAQTSQTAAADCLPAAERAQFERRLLALFRASDLTIDQLETHAADRLGLGRSAPGAATTQTDEQRRAALAAAIADSLEDAAALHVGNDTQLAAIEEAPRVPGGSQFPYRAAAADMATTYSEIERYARLARQATTPAERDRYRRLRSSAFNGSRASASARSLVQSMLSGDPDPGAVLGEFWFNHFNVSTSKAGWAVVDYQKALRRRVCGTFREMLYASAKHPAMLMFLDNFRSTASAINENYGRELLELHTLGDDRLRFYRQQDVVGVARVLTGWGVGFARVDADTTRPQFAFYRSSHDPAAIRLFQGAPAGIVLNIPAAELSNGVPRASAVSRGELLLDYLAAHPATRANICRKLSVRILGSASAEVVNGCVADNIWGNAGDLGAVYRYLFTQPTLWSSAALQNKYKNPIELVLSAHRRTGVPRARVLTLPFIRNSLNAIAQLGLDVADVAPPTGYDDNNQWRSAGELLRWTPILFANLDVDSLGLDVNGQTLRGPALERHVRAQLTTAAASANPILARRTFGNQLAVEMLGVPETFALAPLSIEDTFTQPDTLRAGGEQTLVRSFVETALAQRWFLKK